MNYTYKQIWLINFPVMMSILMEQLINITDAVFLGHVGEIELGASAIAGIYYLAIYMLGFGFSIGLQVMVARRNGEQDYKETGKTFFQGLFFLLGLAIFLYLLIHTVSPFILKKLIVSSDIYRTVILYLDWRSFGLLFSFPFLAIRSFLVGITHTKALSWAAAIAVLINIPLNFYLIFTYDTYDLSNPFNCISDSDLTLDKATYAIPLRTIINLVLSINKKLLLRTMFKYFIKMYFYFR